MSQEPRIAAADAIVLAHLDEVGGYVTGRIARDVYQRVDNMRARSARMRVHLLELEGRGLVALLDNEKPAAWVRTKLGSELLEGLIKEETEAEDRPMSTDLTKEEGLAMHRKAEAQRLYCAINTAASSVAGATVIIDRTALLALIAAERALERECVATEAEVSSIIEGDDHAAVIEFMGFEPDTRDGGTSIKSDRFVARLVYPNGPPDGLTIATIFRQRPVKIVELPNG